MDTILGTIDRILYHKIQQYSESGNKYLISKFNIKNGRDTINISVKGEMNSPIYGWEYTLYGDWEDSEKYGRTFAFVSFDPSIVRSHEGMADYLARSVPAIGKVRARRFVDHFGNESLKVLRSNPERAIEVEGITRTAVNQIVKFFTNDNPLDIDPAAYSKLFDLLSPIRPPRRVFKSLIDNFGSNAPQFVMENPYKLLDYPGMGWKRVDDFAVGVLRYNPVGIERHREAISEVLMRHSETGHIKMQFGELHAEATNLLGNPLVKSSFDSLVKEKQIVIDDDRFVSLYRLWIAEHRISENIKRIYTLSDVLPFDLDDELLADEQRAVPAMVRDYSVAILSGVPGSGKSFCISRIIKSLYSNGITDILVVAPTGKAAKRNQEFLYESIPGVDIPCMTIHRALGGQLGVDVEQGIPENEARINRGRDRFTFEHGPLDPLPYQFFIMDETSMCDCELMASFLSAIPDGARLLLVGDRYQLPSVGPGSVLRDLMASGIPSITFEQPRRNCGDIALACYNIKEGKRPIPNREDSNWTHIQKTGEENILEVMCNIHKKYTEMYGYDKAKENLQVVSPEKKGILGCININRVLSPIVNPLCDGQSIGDNDDTIRKGDKIIRIKNGIVKMLSINSFDEDLYDHVIFDNKVYIESKCYVVNGDPGIVEGLLGPNIVVRFSSPDRLCLLEKSDPKIILSYACTVHKVQGSGYPVVITPFHDFYWNHRYNTGLYNRELLYTTFSRPISRFISVGPIECAYRAIDRVTIGQRLTRLESLINDWI